MKVENSPREESSKISGVKGAGTGLLNGSLSWLSDGVAVMGRSTLRRRGAIGGNSSRFAAVVVAVVVVVVVGLPMGGRALARRAAGAVVVVGIVEQGGRRIGRPLGRSVR